MGRAGLVNIGDYLIGARYFFGPQRQYTIENVSINLNH